MNDAHGLRCLIFVFNNTVATSVIHYENQVNLEKSFFLGIFSTGRRNPASNLIEIQRIETATYSNMACFPGEHFLYF